MNYKNLFLSMKRMYILFPALCVMSQSVHAADYNTYISAPKLALYGSYAMATGTAMGLAGVLIEHYLYPKKNPTKAAVGKVAQQLQQTFAANGGMLNKFYSLFTSPFSRWYKENKFTFYKPGLYLAASGLVMTTSSVAVHMLQTLIKRLKG
jgi:hypothetical protein